MDKTLQGSVELTFDDGIATIELFHPAQNSMPGRLLTSLVQAFQTAGDSPEAEVVVLRSAGDRSFCAGASFDELAAIRDAETGKNFFLGFANVINAMRKCPKIVIARVQGKAVGGGVGLAAAADYCMATQWASVRLSELAVGIGPFVIGPAVARKMGLSAYSQLALDAGSWQTADWACSKGLFTRVFETAEQMDEAIATLANTLTKSNPEALRLLKQVFWEGTERWDTLLDERAAISGQLVLSDFTRNAIAAFKKT